MAVLKKAMMIFMNFSKANRCFGVVFSFLIFITEAFPPEMFDSRYQYLQEGDLNIGAILSIHSPVGETRCSENISEFRYIKYAEAIEFAINEINTKNIIPNVTLGFVILDDCFLSSLALARAIQFMPITSLPDCSSGQCILLKNSISSISTQSVFHDVIGVLGAYTSQLTVTVANVLSLFQIPQISHTATSDVLSNKKQFPYFFRMVPPDKYQVRVISSVLSHYNWTCVSLVYSEGAYGRGGIKRLKMYLNSFNSNICIAEEIEVQKETSELAFQTVIKRLKTHKKARVIVLFVEVETARTLLQAANKLGMGEYYFISSDSLSLVLSTKPNYCKAIPGSLTVRPYSTDIRQFEDYIVSQATQNVSLIPNKWFRDYINVFNISTSKPNNFIDHEAKNNLTKTHNRHPSICREEEMIYSDFAASLLIDSINAYSNALKHILNTTCKNVSKRDLRTCIKGADVARALQDVQFNGSFGEIMFDRNGDIMGKYEIRQCQIVEGKAVHNAIAEWDMRTQVLRYSETPVWKSSEDSFANEPPESSCAEPCVQQVGLIYHFTKETCCWECIPCKNNEIVTDNYTRCEACDILLWPDDMTRTECIEIVPHHVTITDAVSICLCSVSFFGVLLCICIVTIFARYRREHIIRTTNRELSHVMLTGVFLAYILIFTLMHSPNKVQCFINHIGFNLTFTFIYAPLLVKTTRIYRIFEAGKKTTILPPCSSSSSQVCITIVLIAFQIIIVTVSTSLAPPDVEMNMPVPTEKFVELFCNIPLTGLLSSLSYNLVLVLLCTFYAFKTRRLPDNFNESRFVAFCVDTTLLIWITFVPTYFTTARAYYKVTILAAALLLNANVTLICLFFPKLYTLYEQVRDESKKKEGNCNVFRVVKANNSRSCVTEMSSATQPLRSSSGDNSSAEFGNGLGYPCPSAASFRSIDTLQTGDIKITIGKIS